MFDVIYKVHTFMKGMTNGFLNFVAKYLVLIRKCRKLYKEAIEQGIVTEDTLFNKSVFYFTYYFNILWTYFLMYILLYSLFQFLFDDGAICIDEYGSDLRNRFLYVIYHTFRMVGLLFIWFKFIDILYLCYKGIKILKIKW